MSSVGQSLLQLAKLLKLRAIAVARAPKPAATTNISTIGSHQDSNSTKMYTTASTSPPFNEGSTPGYRRPTSQITGVSGVGMRAEQEWKRKEAFLKDLGATLVIKDECSVRVSLTSRLLPFMFSSTAFVIMHGLCEGLWRCTCHETSDTVTI